MHKHFILYPCLFASACDECQICNHLRKTPAVLNPVPMPDQSFIQFGMDLVGPLTMSKRGNKYIVVLTYYLTKWPKAEAIPSKHASEVSLFPNR